MRVETRALIIGLLGPAIQAMGLVLETAHIITGHWSTPLSARHILFEPGFLIIEAGFLITLACVPLAIEVARATQADVEMPDLEPEPSPETQREPRRRRRLREPGTR